MDNDRALEHLLKIESDAAALVSDAQAEADRRVQESEKKNREAFEQQYKTEAEMRDNALRGEREKIKKQYQKELEDYRQEISGISSDIQAFSALLSEYYLKEL
jgi:vacuolar-type H+-ATPase subunit H